MIRQILKQVIGNSKRLFTYQNLDKTIDQKALHDTSSTFGNILSCKIATDSSGQSKKYGFVQYEAEDSAQKAIEKLNGGLLNDKQVYVRPFQRNQEREMTVDKTKFTNIYIKNLSEATTDEELNKVFSEYGTVTSAVVMRDADGNSKGFGFVSYENAEDAAKAVESLNGQKFDNKEWYTGKAQKKHERELELNQRFEQTMKEAVDKSQGLNLYKEWYAGKAQKKHEREQEMKQQIEQTMKEAVDKSQGLNLNIKSLDDTVEDDSLKELISSYDTRTSCKVMCDPNGTSKGSGLVAFSTPEEASRALFEMNGKMVASKPLYVMQRKVERRARLQVLNIPSQARCFSSSSHAQNLNAEIALGKMKGIDGATIISSKIARCTTVTEINQYRQQMHLLKIIPTTHYYQTLVKKYVECGQPKEARKVAFETNIDKNALDMVQSVLVSALVKKKHFCEAIELCDTLGGSLTPRAAIHMTRYLETEVEFTRLMGYLQVVEKAGDDFLYHEGCMNVILRCVRRGHTSETLELVKNLERKKITNDEILKTIFCKLAEKEPADVHGCIELYKVLEDEAEDYTLRSILDFILSACVCGRDKRGADFIWEQYRKHGLSYNIFTMLKRLQILYATRAMKEADECLEELAEMCEKSCANVPKIAERLVKAYASSD